jgi:hypothetical protein
MITAEELLAGAGLTYKFAIPPGLAGQTGGEPQDSKPVRLRPLTVNDLQLISRAAKESDSLTATLMVQRALVEPQVTVKQVSSMPVGLVQYLLERVNEISGITTVAGQITDAIATPIARAAFVLAREFGWTPEQVNNLTLGQVLLHLEMLREARQ